MSDRFTYIAFFDLDLTLTSAVSGNVLAKTAYKKGLMSHTSLLRALWLSFAYKLSLRDPLKIINEMTGWVKGIPEKTIEELSSEISHNILLPNIYSEALNELKIHSGKNARRVLLSSTPSSVGRVIADSLGIEDIICSELEVVDGYLTGRPSGPLCFREEKAVRMKKYCESNNTTPEESWFYGDSISDFPALSISGFPVCVNPDRKLMKKAIEYGWDTRIWNKKTEKNN